MMGTNLDIEDVCHGHPLAREQLTALMVDNARLRAENERFREITKRLYKYKQVIDEGLVARHLGIAKGNPYEELNAIINYDIELREELRGEGNKDE